MHEVAALVPLSPTLEATMEPTSSAEADKFARLERQVSPGCRWASSFDDAQLRAWGGYTRQATLQSNLRAVRLTV
jgi:hypothetical protein